MVSNYRKYLKKKSLNWHNVIIESSLKKESGGDIFFSSLISLSLLGSWVGFTYEQTSGWVTSSLQTWAFGFLVPCFYVLSAARLKPRTMHFTAQVPNRLKYNFTNSESLSIPDVHLCYVKPPNHPDVLEMIHKHHDLLSDLPYTYKCHRAWHTYWWRRLNNIPTHNKHHIIHKKLMGTSPVFWECSEGAWTPDWATAAWNLQFLLPNKICLRVTGRSHRLKELMKWLLL